MGRKPLGPWVVVGVDGSADALAAVDLAAAEATLRNLRLRVVASAPQVVAEDIAGSAQTNRAVAEAARRAHLTWPELTVRTVVAAGDPAETLIGESRTAGLVVFGSQGGGGGPRPRSVGVRSGGRACVLPDDDRTVRCGWCGRDVRCASAGRGGGGRS